MENFLDSCVVIHYSNYLGEGSVRLLRKCYEFIDRKEGIFILCYAALEEVLNFRLRRKKIHKEVLEKIKNGDHQFSKSLDFRSISTAKKLYVEFKDKNLNEVELHFRKQRENSNLKIEQFLLTKLDEKVISLDQIQQDLINKIHDIISNHADCKILASALQLQKSRKTFFGRI